MGVEVKLPTKTKSTLEFPKKMRQSALLNTASRLKVNVEGGGIMGHPEQYKTRMVRIRRLMK